MTDQTLTEAEKKFLAFDWSKSTEWQTYFSNLYPTPDASKVPKFKRTWFRRNVDSSLSEDSTVGEPVSTKKETTTTPKPTSASSSTKSPTFNFFDKFATKTRLPFLKEFLLRLELVLLLGFVFSTLVVLSARFRTPGSEAFVRNSLLVSKSFFLLYLVVGFVREQGLPKFNSAWFSSMFNDHHVHYFMYGLSFLTVSPKFVYYVPQLLTALLSVNSMYKSYPSVFPRLLQTKKAKEFFSALDTNQYVLLRLRGNLEVAMLPYLLLTVFFNRGNLLPLFVYTNFLRFKVNAKDVYVLNTLKTVHMSVGNFLNNPKFPAGVRNVYHRVVKGLELYFTGRRR